MAIKKVQTSLRLREDVLHKLGRIAVVNKRSVNGQLEYIIEKCVADYERDNGKIDLSKEKE